MKAIGLIITITLVFCCSTNAQNSIVSGGFYQTISDSVSGGSSQSQVSSLVVDTPGASWGFDNFDNRTDTQPFYFHGGANPAFTWTYNAGPAVRGHVNFSAGAFINYPFASDNNPTESTELVFTIQPHTIPKLQIGRAHV